MVQRAQDDGRQLEEAQHAGEGDLAGGAKGKTADGEEVEIVEGVADVGVHGLVAVCVLVGAGGEGARDVREVGDEVGLCEGGGEDDEEGLEEEGEGEEPAGP